MHNLICGSLAYDTIMVFPGHFREHILPEKLHILNVAFLVPEMRREFGGCAGNIAYNLDMLGGSPLIMATAGQDFHAYRDRLQRLRISQRHVLRIPDTFTAQAFITTDLDDNQITAFHPGAMNYSHHNHVADAADVVLGIVAPDGREGLLQHAREFYASDIPFIFDPGQGLPMFSGDELLDVLKIARYLTVNDYEAQLMQEKTGKSLSQLASTLKGLVVTLGAKGSVVYADGREIMIPCVEAEKVVDPTGCGDAYRAGLLYGLTRGMDWELCGRLSALLGAIKIAHRGGQNHSFTRGELEVRFKQSFKMNLC
jgi:adenosine kinase